jgi:tRNA U34 5-carboxymethylaminomethyl modifying GTPase MnmE/TrmE
MLSAEQSRKIITEQVETAVESYLREVSCLVIEASNQMESSIDYGLPEIETVREKVLSRLDELGYAVVINASFLTLSW